VIWARPSSDAVGLALEQRQAAFLLIVERRLVAAHEPIEGGVGLDQGALEGGDRLPGVAQLGPAVSEYLAEPLAVLGDEGEACLHHVGLAVTRDRALGGGGPLSLERLGGADPEQLSVISAVDDGLAVAPMQGAGIAARDIVREAPALIRLVTGGAGHRSITAQPCVEEQQLAELHLLRRYRVVRRRRGRPEGGQGRVLVRPGGCRQADLKGAGDQRGEGRRAGYGRCLCRIHRSTPSS
jgi:hypothetical protein